MDSIFETTEDLELAIAEAFAEELQLFPKDPDEQYRSRTDLTRENALFKGILRFGSSEARSIGRGWQTRLAFQEVILVVARGANPSLDLQKGDQVGALERPGTPVFEVTDVYWRTASSFECKLIRL